jgi:hypothetical protein
VHFAISDKERHSAVILEFPEKYRSWNKYTGDSKAKLEQMPQNLKNVKLKMGEPVA